MVPNGWEVVPIWHPLGFKQKSSVWMGFGPPTPVQCQVGQMMIQPSRILFKLGGKRTANYWKLSSSLARRKTKQHVDNVDLVNIEETCFFGRFCAVSVVFENQNCLPESLNQSRYHFWDISKLNTRVYLDDAVTLWRAWPEKDPWRCTAIPKSIKKPWNILKIWAATKIPVIWCI